MNAIQHMPGSILDTGPVASVPAPRVPAHDNLVIEHLSEFAAQSVTGMCHVTASDSLSFLRH